MDAHSPLYGRAVESMQLGPIPAGYIGDALGVSDPVALLRAFSVWGGVPRYWELAAVFGQDLDMAVDDLVLSPLGPLHMEPDRILSAEMPSAHSLRPVLDVIGAGAHRVSEIGGRLGQPASSLSRPLARLVDLGMVRREKPFGASERGTKRTLYKIADPFLRTWFRVVAPRRAQLASVPSSIRRKIWSAEKAALFASAFEDICRDAVPGFYEKKNAPARIRSFGAAGRYWEAGRGEWDVVSLSMDGTKLLLGEVKWREKDADERFIKKALNELRSRGVPKKGAWSDLEVVHALFVPRVKKGVRKGHFGAAVVEAKDILRVIR